MKKTLTLLSLLFSLASFGQIDQTLLFEHNGGNGGDDDEIMIKNTLLQVGMFLDSSDGQALFSKDVNSKIFISTVKNIDIRVVEDVLTDKFGMKRCALNFPEGHLAVFNRGCLDNLRNNVNDLYVLLTHEALNIMGLELPDDKSGSVYPLSTRIAAIGPLVIARSKGVVFSSHCRLGILNHFQHGWTPPKMLQNILKDKGYSVISKPQEGKDVHVLQMSLLTQKHDGFVITGNSIQLDESRTAHIESSFLKNEFNGLISLTLDNKEALYAPSPVTIRNAGQQYVASPKGFWKESIIEAFMKLPACVKY